MNNHKQSYLATASYADDNESWCPLAADTMAIGLHYLIRQYADTVNNQHDGYHQLGRLWKDGYLGSWELLVDPDWNCAGNVDSQNDYTCIKTNSTDQHSRLLAGEGTTGCYAFYGYQDSWNRNRGRKLEEQVSVIDSNVRITALLQCRVGGNNAPETYAHGMRFINCTYYDGHVETLGGVSQRRTVINRTYGNHESYWRHASYTHWWRWATDIGAL